MKVNSSYRVKIVGVNRSLDKTINIYREALSYVVRVVDFEWAAISSLTTAKEQYNYIESLIHNTKHNMALYDFDDKFYKYPSYLRRSTTADALGIVSSYRSSLGNYNQEKQLAMDEGKIFTKKPPRLQLKHFKCPALYKGNMFELLPGNQAMIKIFNGNDWVWTMVNLRHQDIKYINKQTGKISSPTLEKAGRGYALRFSFEESVKLNKIKLKDQKIVAVDLGLNHSAVCTLMGPDGTVTKRLFIDQPVEKDHQTHLINRLKKKQVQGGRYAQNAKLWARINNLNAQISSETTAAIVAFAKDNGASVIVVEHLDFKGKRPKNIAQRVHLWAVKGVQEKLVHKAHREGIRLNSVNARNTSRLAFDGSGTVKRNKTNAKLCVFATGKQYNCDLNASYNIGARYFISETKKPSPRGNGLKLWQKFQSLSEELSALCPV